MCCEICPRYTNCEEDGHLNESCCASCPERSSCRDENGSKDKDPSEPEDELI